ncbi:MAG: hypothetical protein RR869_10350, partial [Lachnospiraceae bacterium]
MVKEVNATGVEPSEQLSDHVYHFDAKTLELSIPATQEHQKLESFDTTNAITKKRESKSR